MMAFFGLLGANLGEKVVCSKLVHVICDLSSIIFTELANVSMVKTLTGAC